MELNEPSTQREKEVWQSKRKVPKGVRLTTPQPQQPANVELHQRNHSALFI